MDRSSRKAQLGFFRHLWRTYDHTVLGLIMINGFNRGGRSVAVFSLILIFKALGISENWRQVMFAVIYSPQILAVPMALFSEAVPIFGSRTKSYIFLSSIFMLGACLNLAI